MEIRTLKYFLTITREENISKAAEMLHITQPTLSRQMSQLEEELGTPLFIRGRHLTLTEAGILLRRRAEEVVNLMEKIDAEFHEQNDLEGSISIGSGGVYVSHALPQIMEQFRQRYPKIHYELYINNADYLKDRLDRGLLDFAMLLEPVDVSKYDYIHLKGRERWGILVRRDHPLASQSCITRKDLLSIPIVTADRVTIQREIASWLGNDISKLNIFATYNISTTAPMLVQQGVACALTLEGAVQMYVGRDLLFLPLDPELSTGSVMAWKKFQPASHAAARFLEFFQQSTDTIDITL